MADPLFPQAVNDAMDGSPPTSQGALSQVADTSASGATSNVVPASVFGNSNKYQEKLFDLLSKPPVDESAKWLGFAGAMGAPTKTGSFGESLGGGLSALAKGKTEEEALKQQYKAAMIQQYSLLARQQNALSLAIPGMNGGTPAPGASMQPGQGGGMVNAGLGGQPGAGGAISTGQQQPQQDPWEEKVPGYYGLSKRDVANYINSDPSGKSLAEAREKRATSSQRAGSLLFNMDPNTGAWVMNGSSLTGASLLKTIESQITSDNTEVRVPNSDGTETVMSRSKALHLHDDVSKLLGQSPVVPPSPPASAAPSTETPSDGALRTSMAGSGDHPVSEADFLSHVGSSAPSAPQGGPGTAPAAVSGTSQSPGAKEAATTMGGYAGSIPKQINEEADNAIQGQYGIAELQNLLKNFTPGRAAPLRQWMTEYASQLGVNLDPNVLSSASSMEAFNKIAMGLATQASKQLSSRPSQLEFQKMLEANPNIQLLPEGLQKIIVYNEFKNNLALRKQQEFYNWAQDKSPAQYDQFLPHWNKIQLQNLGNPGFRSSLDTKPVAKPAGASNTSMTLPVNIQTLLDKYK